MTLLSTGDAPEGVWLLAVQDWARSNRGLDPMYDTLLDECVQAGATGFVTEGIVGAKGDASRAVIRARTRHGHLGLDVHMLGAFDPDRPKHMVPEPRSLYDTATLMVAAGCDRITIHFHDSEPSEGDWYNNPSIASKIESHVPDPGVARVASIGAAVIERSLAISQQVQSAVIVKLPGDLEFRDELGPSSHSVGTLLLRPDTPKLIADLTA